MSIILINNVSLGITDSNIIHQCRLCKLCKCKLLQSFDDPSIGNLFDNDIRFKPNCKRSIHVAHSENPRLECLQIKRGTQQ